jgi:hypothetical protein
MMPIIGPVLFPQDCPSTMNHEPRNAQGVEVPVVLNGFRIWKVFSRTIWVRSTTVILYDGEFGDNCAGMGGVR